MTVHEETYTDSRHASFPAVRFTCLVATVTMVSVGTLIALDAQLGASMMASFIALGMTLLGMAVAAAAWGAWAVGRRVHGPVARALGTLVTTSVAVAVAAVALSAWAYSDPQGKYAREFGGTGRCLADTPYGSTRAEFSLQDEDRMTVSPRGAGDPQLLFDHASKGELTPADDRTRQIIATYGC